jgi:hypothetical protein
MSQLLNQQICGKRGRPRKSNTEDLDSMNDTAGTNSEGEKMSGRKIIIDNLFKRITPKKRSLGKEKEHQIEEESKTNQVRVLTENPDEFQSLINEKKELLYHSSPDVKRIQEINSKLEEISTASTSKRIPRNMPKHRLNALEKHRRYLANIEQLPETEVFGKTRFRNEEIIRVKKMISNLERKLGIDSCNE